MKQFNDSNDDEVNDNDTNPLALLAEDKNFESMNDKV